MSDGIERIGWAVRVEHLTGWRWYRNHGHVVWSDHGDAIDERDTNRVDGFPAEVWEIHAAPEGTIESLEAERDQLKAREEHFASVLGGARITAVLAERDELRATVERYREALFAVDDVEECDSCPPDHSCGCALNRAREVARDALVPFQPTEGENGHE